MFEASSIERLKLMGHRPSTWSFRNVSFETAADLTDDPMMTLLVQNPAGKRMFTGEPDTTARSCGRRTLGLWLCLSLPTTGAVSFLSSNFIARLA